MASQRNGGPSVISPPSSFRSLDPFPQLSPTASSSSRPSGPPRNARQQSIMSTFSSLAEFTPTKASSAYSASRQYTPNPNLRHISSSSVLPSDSGASTPDYKRRARRMAEKGLIKEGERDWGNVEPDEVFRKLPVLEVRRVEGKMRQEALDKQSELRAMVGTRYRDLLTSATQISTLRTASLHLSDSLRTVANTCSNADDIAITAENSTQVSDTEDVMTLLPVAAHMKLLLDAPEALYAYLAEGEVLRAGWLWLVARVVKEGLAGMGEASEVYQPLLAKQWEVLVPFRAQIVQRASEKLRSKDKIETRTLAETLLTIVLLDNLPVPEALSLLLSQRSLALRDLLAHPTASAPAPGPSSRTGKSVEPSLPPAGPSIGDVLGSAVQCLLSTSEAAHQVFAKQSDRSESLLEELIRLVQKGDINPPTITQHTPLRRSSSSTHTRRASRLVSISLPFNDPSSPSTSDVPPITTIRILRSLPSSQILLRHLPASITGFTPFITPPQSPDLDTQLEKWQSDGLGILGGAAPAWLADLSSAQAVWAVRGSLVRAVGEGEFEGRIGKALEDEWGARTRGIWIAGFSDLVHTTEREVGRAVEEIQSKGNESDINPEKYVFSAMTFPSVASATLNIPNPVSFPTFMAGVKKRNVYRTPLLDRVLSVLEDQARALQSDVRGLPEGLVGVYTELVADALERIVAVLRASLDGLREMEDGGEKRVYAELLVGRVALFLARQSTFLEDLSGRPKTSSDPILTSLISLHADSTSSWRTTSITTALTHLTPLFSPLRGPREVLASWQGPHPISPSASVVVTLNSLVKAIRHLGIPPSPPSPDGKGEEQQQVVRQLVEGFVDSALELEGWAEMKDESCVQAVVDLGFLCLVRGGKVADDAAVQGMLNRIPESYQTTLPPLLSPILAESLRRVQLILHPILTHLPPTLTPSLDLSATSAPAKTRGPADTRAQLLRFGAPLGRIAAPGIGSGEGEAKSAGTTEFRSPIAVAKPGKRFGLVSIAS